MFISFSICCHHFTSLAYEIFYARKVDLFDKIKEAVFPNFFRVCQDFLTTDFHSSKSCFFLVSNHPGLIHCKKSTIQQFPGVL
jgi:hypothetical protein